VIFTEQYFSAQSISSPLSLPVFDNVCHDPVIVNAEVGVVKFNHSFASNLLQYLFDLRGLEELVVAMVLSDNPNSLKSATYVIMMSEFLLLGRDVASGIAGDFIERQPIIFTRR
jgi:hypothetical protein